MKNQTPFKWRYFEAEIILLCVRWYLRYSLSYRDLEEMMAERELSVGHTTIYRWVQHYGPELDKRCRPRLKACNDSWKVDETYIKVKKVWMYLYRAVDSEGNTLEFLLSPTRDAQAAKRFFLKALHSTACSAPQACPVGEQVAQPTAPADLKASRSAPLGSSASFCNTAPEEINPFQATYNYQQYKLWRDSCAHDHRTTTWKLSPAPFT